MNGKGSLRRPGREISQAEWARIFRREPFYCPRRGYEAEPTVCTKCGAVYVENLAAPTPVE